MLHLSYGKCVMFLVLDEKVGDVRQGGVAQFPLPPFASGAMRGRFHKGDLYVSGLRGWQTSGVKDGAGHRRLLGRGPEPLACSSLLGDEPSRWDDESKEGGAWSRGRTGLSPASGADHGVSGAGARREGAA